MLVKIVWEQTLSTWGFWLLIDWNGSESFEQIKKSKHTMTTQSSWARCWDTLTWNIKNWNTFTSGKKSFVEGGMYKKWLVAFALYNTIEEERKKFINSIRTMKQRGLGEKINEWIIFTSFLRSYWCIK